MGQAEAQQIYRSVGPDGKVTFSDQPPANNAGKSAKDGSRGATTLSGNAAEAGSSGGATGGTLPYSLQQVASRFPVTLYSGDDCAPCNSARNLLMARGVPFTERTVTNNESIAALKALSGGNNSIPFATIGGQHLSGFSDSEWTQYLDAAGYPKKSQLPPNYQRPAPTPLATAAQPAPATPQTTQQPATRPLPAAPAPDAVAPSGPTPTNPAGLVF
nr:glutaredoxin domain-containing protein [Diaphorobacter aerolatus]